MELALGLTEASKKKARKVAKKLVGQSGATAAQLQGMVEELLTTGLANREALIKIIRFEVDRTLGKVGLATAEEVAELKARVSELQRKLREAEERLAARDAAESHPSSEQQAPGGAEPSTPTEATATQDAAAADSDATGKAVAKKTIAKKAVAKKATAKKAVAKETTAKKTVAKKTVAKKTVAKKTTAKRTAKKAGGDEIVEGEGRS